MPKSKSHQFNLDERTFIQTSIANRYSISFIAKSLNRSTSSVIREIKRNGVQEPVGQMGGPNTRNICIHRSRCTHVDLCKKGCLIPCTKCKSFLCNKICPDFEAQECPKLKKPPYCCNDCSGIYGFGCQHTYHFYEAVSAHNKAQRRKVESRMGIDCTEEDLAYTTEIVKAGLSKGQSLKHIWAANEDKMCCSWRTYYRYVKNGFIEDVKPIDQPYMVRYSPRNHTDPKSCVVRRNLVGRTYEDFEKLPEEVKMSAVEIDCVVGRQGKDKQVILTLLFRRINFQLMILLEECNARNIVEALDMIEDLCGSDFANTFSLILADRGKEFSDTERIEHSKNGIKRCSVYYCDAQRSDQRGKGERNHGQIRRVLPKGKSNFDALTGRDMALLMSHVNSYKRESLGWASPLELAKIILPEDLLDGLGIELIPAEEVMLKPALLPHAVIKK